jgi:plastocyanin
MSRTIAIGCLVALITVFALCAGCTSSAPVPPTPTPPPVATVTLTGTVPAGGTSVALALGARNFAFDKSTLSAPAGATVVLTFVNDDPGVPHNFALYTDSTARTPIFVGTIVTGKVTTTYTFTAPGTAGTYFFRCDPHPATMTGSFVVT